MVSAGPGVQMFADDVMLLQGAACAEVVRVLSAAVVRERRNGIAPSPLLVEVLSVARNRAEPRPATGSELNKFRSESTSTVSVPDPITTKEAAAMLNCSLEYARRLARETGLPARKTSRGWVLSRSAVERIRKARAAQ